MNKFKHISTFFRSCIVAIIMILSSSEVKGQQDPIYSQYMNNLLSINPAYVGVRGVGSASLLSRKQWAGLPGSPMTTSLTLNLALDSLHIGGGFDFVHDTYGPTTTTGLFIDYSYRIRASEKTQLSFGLKGGFNYLRNNLIDLDRYHFDDAYILDNGDHDIWNPNFGVGVFWFGEKFYAGFSVPRLLQNNFVKDETIIRASSREERHYFLHGAYLFDLSPDFAFKPGVTAVMVAGAPISADFDFSFLYADMVWLGAKYRISDAVGAYIHVQLDNYKIGFGYDYSHSRLSQYNFGTFELMLRYEFKTKANQVFPSVGF